MKSLGIGTGSKKNKSRLQTFQVLMDVQESKSSVQIIQYSTSGMLAYHCLLYSSFNTAVVIS